MKKLLTYHYYQDPDVISVAKDLIGKLLVSNIDGIVTSGIIVETEAYKAPEDKASHAYNNKTTPRTRTMFLEGGIAYIFLVYGFHHLFNVVTGPEGIAHAVLIRAVEPMDNTSMMMNRRGMYQLTVKLTNGPGKWTKAFGISTELNGIKLFYPDSNICIYDIGNVYGKNEILCSPRVGIDYASDYIYKPWRFRLKGNDWVGK